MKLIYEKTKEPVMIGDRATTFRGESVVVTGMDEPHKPSSTGRVYIKYSGFDSIGREFFPSVIGAIWVGV